MRRASRTKEKPREPQTQDELQKALRSLQRQPENKRCCDCTERLPQYINLEFNTFICTSCSGIHREMNNRVKGISLSNFSEEEVRNIQKGGNRACNDLYLAKYDPSSDIQEPDGLDAGSRRRFMFAKYKEKRWYGTTEDLVREIEEREAAERAREERSMLRRKKSGGRLIQKSSKPPSEVVMTTNTGRGTTKQMTTATEAACSTPDQRTQAEPQPQDHSSPQPPPQKEEWNPFLDVQEVVAPPPAGEVPHHPEAQAVQYPRDGGHHVAFNVAAQPSAPFILAPPPVYQQQQYQTRTISMASNTGKSGGVGVVGGDAMPQQPINQFQMEQTQQQQQQVGVVIGSYPSCSESSQGGGVQMPGSHFTSFQQPQQQRYSGPNQAQRQPHPEPPNAAFGLVAPQQDAAAGVASTSREAAALGDPFEKLTLNPKAAGMEFVQGESFPYSNGEGQQHSSIAAAAVNAHEGNDDATPHVFTTIQVNSNSTGEDKKDVLHENHLARIVQKEEQGDENNEIGTTFNAASANPDGAHGLHPPPQLGAILSLGNAFKFPLPQNKKKWIYFISSLSLTLLLP